MREIRGRNESSEREDLETSLPGHVYGLQREQGYQEKFVHIFFERPWESKAVVLRN